MGLIILIINNFTVHIVRALHGYIIQADLYISYFDLTNIKDFSVELAEIIG